VVDKLEVERQQYIDDHGGIVCSDNSDDFVFWGVSDMIDLFRNGISDACLLPAIFDFDCTLTLEVSRCQVVLMKVSLSPSDEAWPHLTARRTNAYYLAK